MLLVWTIVLGLVLVLAGALAVAIVSNKDADVYEGNDIQEYMMAPEVYEIEETYDKDLDDLIKYTKGVHDWSHRNRNKKRGVQKPRGKTLGDKRKGHNRYAFVESLDINTLRKEVM